MNLQQLEYIVAVNSYRHFARASERCHVTQPTLSMMIQKLEDELGVKIFDRSKQPVTPTAIGERIIAQAQRTLTEAARIAELVKEEKGDVSGELKIGVIPTLAPYLLPLFLDEFAAKYPLVKLIISERITPAIIQELKIGTLDAGLLATPLNEPMLREQPLFYEELMLYVSDKNKQYKKQYVLPKEIDTDRLWLLEEGHCLRSQILNLCELKRLQENEKHLQYEAGSIETLKNIVDRNDGITIIPELATLDLRKSAQKRLRYFKAPAPVREISMVTHKDFIRQRLVEALRKTIIGAIPEEVKKRGKGTVLSI